GNPTISRRRRVLRQPVGGTSVPSQSAVGCRAMRGTLGRIPAWALLAGIVALSTLLRFWAASQVPTPWILPDETLYGELGRSLYHSGSFEILGHPVRFYSLVYPAIAGLPLSLGDAGLGYSLLKPLQALVMSLAAVPTFLWA